MKLFKRRNKVAKPRHLEIWGHLLESQRFYRRLAAGSVFLAFLGLAGGAYGMFLAVHRPLVFHVDPDGKATPMGRLADRRAPHEVEVKYISKRFLRTTMGFHSDTIESDLADAWNLMTDGLRAEIQAQFASYERERDMSFVEYVKRQRIRTTLKFSSLRVQNHNNKVWSVKTRGIATTWPLNRVGEDAGVRRREFEAQLTVARTPRTELTPNGLLVSAQATKFYEIRSSATKREAQVTTSQKP